jgi:hypothetical protein
MIRRKEKAPTGFNVGAKWGFLSKKNCQGR